MSRPTLTVAICTRNRSALLEETLAAVLKQRCSASWELLVVDNGSTDATPEILKALCEEGAAGSGSSGGGPAARRAALEPEPGADHARNRVLQEAAGDVIIFADDDVTPLPGWIDAYRRAFEDPKAASAAGRIFPQLPTNAPEWVRVLSREIGGPPARYDFGRKPCVIDPTKQSLPFGGNMAVRRQAALDVGGFSTGFGYGRELIPGEDTEISFRLRAAGGDIVYVPAATVMHRVPLEKLTLPYFLKWWAGLGRSHRINKSLGASHAASSAPSKFRSIKSFLKYSVRRARYPQYSDKWLRAIQRQTIHKGEL